MKLFLSIMKNTKPTKSIELPTLEYGPIKHTLGSIHHILMNADTVEITAESEVKTGQRSTQKVLHLSDGQSIIITDKKNLKRIIFPLH